MESMQNALISFNLVEIKFLLMGTSQFLGESIKSALFPYYSIPSLFLTNCTSHPTEDPSPSF